jgi:hypothetical protein
MEERKADEERKAAAREKREEIKRDKMMGMNKK